MISLSALVSCIIYLILAGLIFWLLHFLVDAIGLPEPFRKIARTVLIVGAVLIVIAVLLALIGHPVIAY